MNISTIVFSACVLALPFLSAGVSAWPGSGSAPEPREAAGTVWQLRKFALSKNCIVITSTSDTLGTMLGSEHETPKEACKAALQR